MPQLRPGANKLLLSSNSLRTHGLHHTRLPPSFTLSQLVQTYVHWVGDATHPTNYEKQKSYGCQAKERIKQSDEVAKYFAKCLSFCP